MNNKKKHVLLIVFSLILLLATLYVPQKADAAQRNEHVSFGYPFAFIIQDYADYDAVKYYQQFGFRENTPIVNISISYFFLSLVSIFIVLEVLVFSLEIIDFKFRNWLVEKIENNTK